jgi:DNA-binding transcriptional ArsR family regulator
VKSAALLYRLLGDEARLRLLRVLAKERLNVTELTGVLGLAQSGVSRHLGLLKDADLVVEERDGGFSYYRLAAGLREGSLAGVLQQQFEESAADAAVRADEARLQEVLRLRKENFDAHAGPDTRDARQLVPGRSWAAWSRALGLLLPRLAVADLGCGEGYLTVEAARWASKVIAVDRSDVVLARARALARRTPAQQQAACRSMQGFSFLCSLNRCHAVTAMRSRWEPPRYMADGRRWPCSRPPCHSSVVRRLVRSSGARPRRRCCGRRRNARQIVRAPLRIGAKGRDQCSHYEPS